MDEQMQLTSVENKLFERMHVQRKPVYGVIELLPICNMNCDMCYVRLSRTEMERKGGLRTKDEWMKLARQMQQAGVLFLLLTGGEPLIYPDFKELYLELRRMGFVLTINTNGTLLDEQWAAFFGKFPPRRVNITLYGCDEETYERLCHYSGGFEKAKRGVRLLRENHVDVKINASLVKTNRMDALRIARIAKKLDAALHVDTYMFPATRERDHSYKWDVRLLPEEAGILRAHMLKLESTPQEYMQSMMSSMYKVANTLPGDEEPRKMNCHAGRCSFAINWQGEMRACTMLPEPSVPVFDVGFKEAWKLIVDGIEKIQLAAKCNTCKLRGVCNVCAASALLETGEYNGVPEYMCRYTQGMMYAFARDMNAMRERQKKNQE